MNHDLKTWTEFFIPLWIGAKTFEIRRNDRNFQQGDTLTLREFDKFKKDYTGRVLTRRVTYITSFDQRPDFVVMSIAA